MTNHKKARYAGFLLLGSGLEWPVLPIFWTFRVLMEDSIY